jgi:hypothetical protein
MKRLATLLAAVAALAAGEAAAGPGDCYGDSFRASAEMRAAVVRNDAPRVNFLKNTTDRAGCPAATEACRERAYLIPGNGIIVGAEIEGFRCAVYLAGNGQARAGWLPAAALMLIPSANAPDWRGRWTAGPEQTITITQNDSRAWVLEGDATYGASDPERVRRGGVNMGNFSATVRREDVQAGAFISFTDGPDGTLAYDKGDDGLCRVALRLVGPWMVVNDNGSCGGHNVSFSGIYRQAR